MTKRKQAKALVMTPRFRPRREVPKKGKGSYRRNKPRLDTLDRGFFMPPDPGLAPTGIASLFN